MISELRHYHSRTPSEIGILSPSISGIDNRCLRRLKSVVITGTSATATSVDLAGGPKTETALRRQHQPVPTAKCYHH